MPRWSLLLETNSAVRLDLLEPFSAMAGRAIPKDQVVKLIVGAGQASPSPPVGPALGSKGVKSMDFCKARLLLPSLSPTPPFHSKAHA